MLPKRISLEQSPRVRMGAGVYSHGHVAVAGVEARRRATALDGELAGAVTDQASVGTTLIVRPLVQLPEARRGLDLLGEVRAVLANDRGAGRRHVVVGDVVAGSDVAADEGEWSGAVGDIDGDEVGLVPHDLVGEIAEGVDGMSRS